MSSPPPGPRNAAGTVARCSACGSRIRPEESWCSLCHHSVSAAGGTTEPDAAGPVVPGAEAGSSAEALPAEKPTDPAAAATADRMLAELAAAEAALKRESGLGPLQAKLGTRNNGVVVAVVGGVLLLVIGILGLTLLGLLL